MAGDAALIERFLEMMAAQAGAARNTINAYRADLNLASRALDGKLAQAEVQAVAHLGEEWKGLARATVARKSATIRRFFAFLFEEGLRPDDPSKALPKSGIHRTLPKTLNHDEVERLFSVALARLERNSTLPADIRNGALLELLYGSGLRATELVSLPRNVIHPDRPFLILKGKGGKERLVPISDRARAAVAMWRDHVDVNSLFLFPSGKTHLSRVRLFQIVRALAAEAGIAPERISPHVLRHAFATHPPEGGWQSCAATCAG